MSAITPKIIKCSFHGETFYANLTDGDHPVSVDAPTHVTERPLCIDKDALKPDLLVYVTDRCNLKCPFCFEGGAGDSLNESPQYSFQQLVDFLKVMHIHEGSFWFFGGEPLLNTPWIVSCIQRLTTEGFRFTFNIASNLTLLDQQLLDCSIEYGIRFIVNLNASLKTENGMRYREQVAHNVKLLAINKVNMLGMSVWSPSCMLSMDKIIDRYATFGMRYFDINVAHCFRYTQEGIGVFSRELERFADWYIDKILSHDLSCLWVNPFSKYIRALLFPNEPLNLNACGVGKQVAAISTKGNLYPCQLLVGHESTICGSIAEKTWHPPYKDINDDTIPRCHACDLQYICKGRCLANNVIMRGDVRRPEESRCHMEHVIFACSAYIVKTLLNHPTELAVLKKAFVAGDGEKKSAH